jgi:hypothetical protein
MSKKVKIIVKKESKLTKTLITASFLIGFLAIITPVMATGSIRGSFIARGDDLDFPDTTNIIIGMVDSSGDNAKLMFYQRIYDESGKKAYSMVGMLKDGSLLTTEHYFYCPIFNVWFINVWWVMGEGRVKTTDTDFQIFFRNSLPITLPNTESQWASASIFMWFNPTKEYYEAEFDEEGNLMPPPLNEAPLIMEGESWVLAGVFWDTGIPMDFGFGIGILPIGPVSYMTKYMEL